MAGAAGDAQLHCIHFREEEDDAYNKDSVGEKQLDLYNRLNFHRSLEIVADFLFSLQAPLN